LTTPITKPADHKTDALKILYKRHAQGAIVRSLASIVMWISSLIAYLITLISIDNFISNSVAVLYLILMNPLVLWVLKRIERQRLAASFSLLINLLEIVGYTAVIHAFGGIEATYLLPMYAAVIVYMGIMGTRVMPFIVAALCSSSFGVMLTLEHVGILRTLKINQSFTMPWLSQLGILFVDTILFFVVAFISSYTAQLLKRNRDRLARRNEELQLAIAKAQEGDRLKSEFLANVSHELRTPLNAIIGFSELLKDQYLGELNEKQRESTSAIHASGHHLLSIVSDLLDLGRVEAGKMDLQLSAANLKMIVKNSMNMVRRRSQGAGLGLALTKHLVELHHGAVWACSEGERKGSTFHFVIPV
jgi:signal transduction histidine kinase